MQLDLNKYNSEVSTSYIFQELKEHLLSKGRSRVSKKKYQNTLNVLVCNLSELPEGDASIFSVANSFTIPKRYNSYSLTSTVFREVLDVLSKLGFIEIYLGKQGVTNTIVKPTESFYELYPYEPDYISGRSEYVILKSKDKSLKDYKDDRYTRASRVILEAYNKKLHETDVYFGDRKLHIQYYRIFNDNFQSGGRYYRADVLSLKSKERLELEIDDTPIVEIDFSAMAISLLLASEGKVLDYNPYGFIDDRVVAKKTLITILASKSKEIALKALRQATNKREIKTKLKPHVILEAAEKHNSGIRDHFYKASSLEGMFHESEILTDIIATCLDLDVPVLGVHDGLICKQGDENVLTQVMYDSFTGYFDNKVDQVGVSVETKEGKENIVLTKTEKQYTLQGNRSYKI